MSDFNINININIANSGIELPSMNNHFVDGTSSPPPQLLPPSLQSSSAETVSNNNLNEQCLQHSCPPPPCQQQVAQRLKNIVQDWLLTGINPLIDFLSSSTTLNVGDGLASSEEGSLLKMFLHQSSVVDGLTATGSEISILYEKFAMILQEEIEKLETLKPHTSPPTSLPNSTSPTRAYHELPSPSHDSNKTEKSKQLKKTNTLSLWPILWKTIGRKDRNLAILQAFVYKITLTFGPIVILTALLDHFDGDYPLSTTYLWLAVAGLFFFPMIGSLLFARCNMIMLTIGIQIKKLLITAIYRKVLVLSAKERQYYSIGRIVTLFSEDTNQINLFLQEVHRTIIEPPILLICIYLIYQQVNVAAFVGLGYSVVTFLLTGKCFQFMTSLRKQRLFITDQRNRLMNEFLQNIRLLRIYQWENVFLQNIVKIRYQEIALFTKIGHLFQSIFTLLMICSPNIQAILIFVVYIYLGNTLTVTKAFTTLTLFNVMNSSFIALPTGFQQWSQAIVSSKRIMKYLLVEELSDYVQYHKEEPEIDENSRSFNPQDEHQRQRQLNEDKSHCEPRLSIITNEDYINESFKDSTESLNSSGKKSVALMLRKSSLSWTNLSSSSTTQLDSTNMGSQGGSGDHSTATTTTASRALSPVGLWLKETNSRESLSDMLSSNDNHNADRRSSFSQFINNVRSRSSLTLGRESLAKEDDFTSPGISIENFQDHEDDDYFVMDNLMRNDQQSPFDGKDQIVGALLEKKESSWSMYNDQTPTLRKLQLSILEGELVAIIGNVGSGKSSFLASLMGEMTLLSGSISMNNRFQNQIAYCEQTPWVINATVKENILLGSNDKPFCEEHFQQAIYASGLQQDLKQLSNGLETEVGEKGKTLSGGQRARISFARAIYSNAEIILLDDPLSAVDAHVCKHMFHEGILKALHGKTRLLVTHSLQVLPYCDRIIELQTNGLLGFVGTYNEFQEYRQEKEDQFQDFPLVIEGEREENVIQNKDKDLPEDGANQEYQRLQAQEDVDSYFLKKLAAPSKIKVEREKEIEAEEAIKQVVEDAIFDLFRSQSSDDSAATVAAINTAMSRSTHNMAIFDTTTGSAPNLPPPLPPRILSNSALMKHHKTLQVDPVAAVGESGSASPSSPLYELLKNSKSNSAKRFDLSDKSIVAASPKGESSPSQMFRLGPSGSISIPQNPSTTNQWHHRHEGYAPAVIDMIASSMMETSQPCESLVLPPPPPNGRMIRESPLVGILRKQASIQEQEGSPKLFELVRQRSSSCSTYSDDTMDKTLTADLGIETPDLSHDSNATLSKPIDKETLTPNDDIEANVPKETTNAVSSPSNPSKQFMRIQPRTYWSYVTHGGVWFGVITTLLIIASQGIQIYSGFWLADWGQDSSSSYEETMYYLDFYAIFQVIGILLLWLSRYFLISHRATASLTYHNEMISTIMYQEMSFFDKTPLGELLDRFSQDLITLDDELTKNLSGSADILITMLCVFAVIIYTTNGLILILLIPLILLYRYYYQRFSVFNIQLTQFEVATRSPIYSHFTQTMYGLSSIRVYHCQQLFIVKLEEFISQNSCICFLQGIAIQWISLRLSFIGTLVVFAIGAIGVGLESKNLLTISLFAMALTSSIKLTNLLKVVVRFSASTESQFNAIQRIDDFCRLSTNDDADALTTTTCLNISGEDFDHSIEQDNNGVAIEFRNVHMKYKYGPMALKGMSFKAKIGQRIGIVGRTGCGKSSVIAALFQMEKLIQGDILIKGQSIIDHYSSLNASKSAATSPGKAEILSKVDSLKKELCLIPQEPVMFSNTIRFNLDPLNQYTDDEIWNALNAVQLKDYINSLPDKLLEMVTESGENISIGRRQLICIARAILRKPSILLMDEATASMDSETDKFIQETLRLYFRDCTILTIAHRLNTIIDYDLIMVLDQGKVIEFDSPQALMEKEQGVFQALWKNSQH